MDRVVGGERGLIVIPEKRQVLCFDTVMTMLYKIMVMVLNHF